MTWPGGRSRLRGTPQGDARRFAAIDPRFTGVNQRLDKIAFAISGHDGRIDALEDRVRQIATKVGINLN